ncbi:MAG TPA: hypothetical protein VEH47_00445, partial [Candidatus Acidoferrales bacterium]|nr:hypothetical protein [Candidatus Acidoferrales bacterium]
THHRDRHGIFFEERQCMVQSGHFMEAAGSDFEERWKEWQRKGREREEALRKKQRVAISVAIVVGAICLCLFRFTTVLR